MASNDELRFAEFADHIDEIARGNLEPQTLDVELVNTCLTRLRAIERLKPSPPSTKYALACLRDEIDFQILAGLDISAWDEQTRTAHYEKIVGILDEFLESDHSKIDGLPEVGTFFRRIIAGFKTYRGKIRQ